MAPEFFWCNPSSSDGFLLFGLTGCCTFTLCSSCPDLPLRFPRRLAFFQSLYQGAGTRQSEHHHSLDVWTWANFKISVCLSFPLKIMAASTQSWWEDEKRGLHTKLTLCHIFLQVFSNARTVHFKFGNQDFWGTLFSDSTCLGRAVQVQVTERDWVDKVGKNLIVFPHVIPPKYHERTGLNICREWS